MYVSGVADDLKLNWHTVQELKNINGNISRTISVENDTRIFMRPVCERTRNTDEVTEITVVHRAALILVLLGSAAQLEPRHDPEARTLTPLHVRFFQILRREKE